ncbi:ATP-binding protein [Kitasatospora sp. NPDC101801]|uniref:ATP-binding protein n=1 Tax=Kitasatospora sp. NPDC101801 TaxID=3364103 RepID=UPI0037F41C59
MSHPDESVSPRGAEADSSHTPPRRVVTAGDARAALTELVRTLDCDTDRLLADAHLAATELVANAHRHAGGLTGFRAHIDHRHRRLVVDVEDADDRHPVGGRLDQRDPETPGGRGWALVQILASTSAIEALPGGGKRIRTTYTY